MFHRLRDGSSFFRTGTEVVKLLVGIVRLISFLASPPPAYAAPVRFSRIWVGNASYESMIKIAESMIFEYGPRLDPETSPNHKARYPTARS